MLISPVRMLGGSFQATLSDPTTGRKKQSKSRRMRFAERVDECMINNAAKCLSLSLGLELENLIIQFFEMSNYSYLLKYIIIGDASVGKSCILMQFLEGKFKVDSETTVGVEFGSKIITVGQDRLKLQIWDTAGQEIFKSITRSYYRGSIGAILMYDITSRQSFANVGKWIDETHNYANEKLTIMLVGNKNDLDNKREVTKEEGQKFAEYHKMLFLECSAKEKGLTEALFFGLAQEIIRKIGAGEIDPKNETLGVKVGTYRNLVEQTSEKLYKKTCC